MKLHSLRVHAFGPFADDAEVDFDALGADGLFLLHGQTGAGKTTVLDAVAFALFGRVPGTRNDGRRLLSDHAEPGDCPRVELEATIGGRRLRISRSPEHRRPKRRGAGETTVNAKATLIWVDRSGPDLTRANDIGEVVGELLGMSAEQFFQVVLLPQGEFATFLRADTDARQKVLERLFDTHRFDDLEEWLRARAKAAREDLEKRSRTVESLAAQIAQVATVDPALEPDTEWSQQVLDDARASAHVAAADLAAARAAADAAIASHDQQARVHGRQAQGRSARERLAELDSATADVEAARSDLAAARRVTGLRALDTEHTTAQAVAAQADVRRRTVESKIADCVLAESFPRLDWPDTEACCARLDAVIDETAIEIGRLEPLTRRAARLGELRALIDDGARGAAVDRERAAVITQRMQQIPGARVELEVLVERSVHAGARIAGIEEQLGELSAQAAAHAELIAAQSALEVAERHALAAHQADVDAHEVVLMLRERRLDGMAAELAARLIDGEPCGVCGSPQHPAPAQSAAGRVTDLDELAAAQRRDEAAAALAAARSEQSALAARVAAARERTGGREHTWLTGEIDRCTDDLAVARAESAAGKKCRVDIAELDAEADRLRSEAAEIDRRIATVSERVDQARAQVTEIEDAVRGATGGVGTVAQRRDALVAFRKAAAAVRDARAAATSAANNAGALRVRLDTMVAESGFEDLEKARGAYRTDAETVALEQRLSEVDQLRAAAMATLDDPEVIAALAVSPVDIDAARAQRDTAVAQAQASAAAYAVAAQREQALTVLVADYWSAVSVLEPAARRHAEVTGLAELVSGRGQNSRQMSLRTYVLAARLEEVLVAASARLREMSSGRYEFEHNDAAEARGKRSGLGIEVRDEYTGTVRPTTTLSGGETFFASLALALGLADVVSAESGGRVLDTIFIDEGFGSLDPEALDLVMGVLDNLRSGGRVVGVVSHVDEMRARIPTQLQVIRGRNGSRLQTVGVAV
ncbi:AAA family ATPase [Williamsia sp. CHRR-6]|uniref:AAA family ATPase n=1 Tax=Williamsia sp. CHRR-6 TaxID=2835871 RepID=UPI001BD958AF|nr:SMC family ATPase [Williamsia sp. CHRR-6]MBT0568442.1 SMC family ATPase [Williamsia sp. CHRR-6]